MSYAKFEQFETISPAPRPFPGDYPTRIRIKAYRGVRPFEYIGKPVSALKGLVSRQYLRVGGDVSNLLITEFDQNGVIWQLRGGLTEQRSTFADIYFSIPTFFRDALSRRGNTLVMLDRKLVTVDGVSVYMNRFWTGTAWAEKAYKRVQDAVHARLARRRFTEMEEFQITDFINYQCVAKWLTTPRVATAPALPGEGDIPDPLPTLPMNVDPWGTMQDIPFLPQPARRIPQDYTTAYLEGALAPIGLTWGNYTDA